MNGDEQQVWTPMQSYSSPTFSSKSIEDNVSPMRDPFYPYAISISISFTDSIIKIASVTILSQKNPNENPNSNDSASSDQQINSMVLNLICEYNF